MQVISKKEHALEIFRQYLKEILILAIPIFIGSLGHTLLGATDVFIVAKYSIKALAAISISNSIIFTEFILGIGIMTAISIILSNMRGSKKGIKKYLPTVLVFSFIFSLIFMLLCLVTTYFIPHMGFETDIVPYIKQYITIVSFSMFGIFFFEGIKQFLQAYEIVKLPNLIILGSVVINLIFDIIFVFGFGFIPAMGSSGAAVATLSVRIISALILFIYVYKYINWKSEINFSFMKMILKIGFPIGLALVFEFLAFNIITLLVARESTTLAAVHSILITIGSATFMVPLAVSIALSIKVAYYYGAKLPNEIKRYSYTALVFGVGFMVLISILLALFPRQIIGIFTSDSSVIQPALSVMSIVAVYQIFDGFQAVTGGILKGFKMTKTVSFCVLMSYWFVGAPIAAVFVCKYNFSLRGYWLALAVSLCVMGFIQAAIAKKKYKSKLLA